MTIEVFGEIALDSLLESLKVLGFAFIIYFILSFFEGKIASLQREKDQAKEVKKGFECGILLDGYNDVKEMNRDLRICLDPDVMNQAKVNYKYPEHEMEEKEVIPTLKNKNRDKEREKRREEIKVEGNVEIDFNESKSDILKEIKDKLNFEKSNKYKFDEKDKNKVLDKVTDKEVFDFSKK